MFSDASLGPVFGPTQAVVERPVDTVRRGLRLRFLFVVVMVGVTCLLLYLVIRGLAIFYPGYTVADRSVAVLLLLSEVYISLQGIGYYLQVAQTARVTNVARTTCLADARSPRVAVYIATYNESEAVIDTTVNAVSLLNYPAASIYVNCDHQSQEQADRVAEIARRHHVEFLHRVPNTGYKAGGINAFLGRLGRDLPDADFLCIFDADSVPQPSFLREVILHFQNDPRIAYVQAPQFYGNREVSLVADAAGHQQATFAQFISEGKQASEAMFYCGTNVVFRVDALRDIGGLRTTSITEDFLTSIKLHARGWKSEYCNTSYVIGMGPETLQAYWIQQSRWALGNLESFRLAIRDLWWRPGLTLWQRWEYTLSGTYYLAGWNTWVAMTIPAVFLIFGFRPLMMSPMLYLIAYVPHLLVSNMFFFLTMRQRGYQPKMLFTAQYLTFITYPVYMGAAIAALRGEKRAFAVTPKGISGTLALSVFWPIIAQMALLIIAVLFGLWHTAHGVQLAVLINIGWCLYHIALLAQFPRFNAAPQLTPRPSLATQ